MTEEHAFAQRKEPFPPGFCQKTSRNGDPVPAYRFVYAVIDPCFKAVSYAASESPYFASSSS